LQAVVRGPISGEADGSTSVNSCADDHHIDNGQDVRNQWGDTGR